VRGAPHGEVDVDQEQRLQREQRPHGDEHGRGGRGADRLRDRRQRQHARADRAADDEEHRARDAACAPAARASARRAARTGTRAGGPPQRTARSGAPRTSQGRTAWPLGRAARRRAAALGRGTRDPGPIRAREHRGPRAVLGQRCSAALRRARGVHADRCRGAPGLRVPAVAVLVVAGVHWAGVHGRERHSLLGHQTACQWHTCGLTQPHAGAAPAASGRASLWRQHLHA